VYYRVIFNFGFQWCAEGCRC